MSGYFGRALMALFVALVIIALDVVYPHLPFFLGVAAVIPLVVYHLAYLAPRAPGLKPAEVDSVYYLGFLITVAALAAAALQIATAGQTDVAPVLRKFAAGLLATGYAVIARLHLQSVARSEPLENPEQILDSYVSRSGLLLDNLEIAILRLGNLSEKAIAETERVVSTSQSLLDKRAKGTIEEVDRALRTCLEGAVESVGGMRLLITDPSFSAERQAFASSLRDGIAASRALKTALEKLVDDVGSTGDSFDRGRAALDSLTGSSEVLNAQLGKMLGEYGALASTASDMTSASEASQRAAESARIASAGVAELVAKLASSGAALGELELSAAGAGATVGELSTVYNRLSAAAEQLADVLKASENLASGLDRIGYQLPELVPKIQTIGQEFDALHRALTSTASSLEADVHRSKQAVGLLAEGLAEVADTIIKRTQERQARV